MSVWLKTRSLEASLATTPSWSLELLGLKSTLAVLSGCWNEADISYYSDFGIDVIGYI